MNNLRLRNMMNRRAFVTALLGTGILSACSNASEPGTGRRGRAALLLPLTGPHAALGEELATAARFAGAGVGLDAAVEILDAGSGPETAVAAARAAVEGGARMLLGPVFANQVSAVAAQVPDSVPIVALSNDNDLAREGVFVFGLTPLQSAQAALSVAAARGLKSLALVADDNTLGRSAASAAAEVAAQVGATVEPVLFDPSDTALSQLAGAGKDAIYIPTTGASLATRVAVLRRGGSQIIGSAQWSSLDREALSALRGAWFAAPDPLRFQSFGQSFAALTKQRPGVISGLVFDATEVALALGREGQQSRSGLTRRSGFQGTLGQTRLLRNGQTERALAVLAISDGGEIDLLGSKVI